MEKLPGLAQDKQRFKNTRKEFQRGNPIARRSEVLSSSLSPPQLSVGKTSVYNPYKMLWNFQGVLWPRISMNWSFTRRTYSQSQDTD